MPRLHKNILIKAIRKTELTAHKELAKQGHTLVYNFTNLLFIHARTFNSVDQVFLVLSHSYMPCDRNLVINETIFQKVWGDNNSIRLESCSEK